LAGWVEQADLAAQGVVFAEKSNSTVEGLRSASILLKEQLSQVLATSLSDIQVQGPPRENDRSSEANADH